MSADFCQSPRLFSSHSSSTTATVIERTAIAIKSKIINSKLIDQRYNDSFGDQLTNFGGYNRWVLTGFALSIWEKEVRSRIGELIKANESYIHKDHDVLSTATIHHCWMIGHGKQNAAPTVIISHNVRKVLKRVMRTIKQHKVLDSHGFEIKGCPFCDLQLFMGSSTSKSLHNTRGSIEKFMSGAGAIPRADTGHESLYEYRPSTEGERYSLPMPFPNIQFLVGDSPAQQTDSKGWNRKDFPISLCGAQVATKDPAQRATLGGTIILNGEFYGLTVAHIFMADTVSLGRGDYPTADCTLYGSDWADSSSEGNSVFDDDNGTALHNKSRDSVSDDDSDDNDEDGSASGLEILSTYAFPTSPPMSPDTTPPAGLDVLPSPYVLGNDSLIARSSQNPFKNSLEGLYDDVDWAILKLPDARLRLMNSTVLEGAQPSRLYLQGLAEGAPQGQVVVVAREGAVNAFAVGSADSIKLLGSDRPRKVYSIRPEKPLGPGCSGAWVVNATSGDIYGVLIAGSVFLQECFVVPMGEILTDIKRITKPDDLRLPMLEETASLNKQLQPGLRTNLKLTTTNPPGESEVADVKSFKTSRPFRSNLNGHRDRNQPTKSPANRQISSRPIKGAAEPVTEMSRHTRELETLATIPWTTSRADVTDKTTRYPSGFLTPSTISNDSMSFSGSSFSDNMSLKRSVSLDDSSSSDHTRTASPDRRPRKPLAERLQSCEKKIPGPTLLQMIRDGSGEALIAALKASHRSCSCLEERDEKGRTPLVLAASLGREDMVETLLTCEADLQAVDDSQSTALHAAARHHHWPVVILLLKSRDTGSIMFISPNRGVDVNKPDKRGRTPLHYCTIFTSAEHETRDAIRLLIAQKADIDVKDAGGKPPIYYAIKDRRYLVVDLLLEKGAGLDFQWPETSAEIEKLLDDHIRGIKVTPVLNNAKKRDLS